MLCTNPKNRCNLSEIKQHPWYRNKKGIKCYGISIGYETIPIDKEILKEMQDLGYDPQNTKKFIENNVRNETTTAYWLLLKKKHKDGSPS